jgi:hypothetical protein
VRDQGCAKRRGKLMGRKSERQGWICSKRIRRTKKVDPLFKPSLKKMGSKDTT